MPDQIPLTAVLVERDGRYFFYEPGLGIIGSAESIENAYSKFAAARREYLAEAKLAGVDIGRTAPSGRSGPPSEFRIQQGVGREVGIFVLKLGIILLLIVGIVGPLADGIGRSVSEAAAKASVALSGLGSISLQDVSRKAADIARDAHDLPADKKEQLRESVGAISRELSPIFDAWRNPPDASGSSKER